MVVGIPTYIAAVASGTSVLTVFNVGADALPYATYSIDGGATWTAWTNTNIGGYGVVAPPIAVSSASNTIDLFVYNGTSIYWNRCTNVTSHTWAGFTALASLPYAPYTGTNMAVSSPGSGVLDIVYTASTQAVYWNHYNGSTWSGWSTLSGGTTYTASVMSLSTTSLIVGVAGGAGVFYYKLYSGNWGPWTSISGATLTGAPSSTKYSTNNVFFAIDASNKVWCSVNYGTFAQISSGVGSPVAVGAARTSSDTVVVIRNTAASNYLYAAHDTGSWGSWAAVDSTHALSTFGPVIIAGAAANQVDVFYIDTNGAIWHTAYAGTSWTTPNSVPNIAQDATVSLTPISSAAATQAPTLRGDANVPTLTSISSAAATQAPTIARADAKLATLTPISSAAAAQAPTIAEADCNIPALSPITSAVAPVAPALRGDANIPTLTPVSNSAASVAATIARADCNIPALTPISSTAATISLSSLIISVGLTLSTITNTVAPITPTARADAIVPTLTPISSSASIISPTTVVSVAVLLAAINATAAAIDASIAQADAILSLLSPPGAVASVTSPALTISAALTLSPINVNSSIIALSSLRADAIIPSLTPITSTAATVGVTVSTGSFVHILLTPIGSNAGVIAPALRSDAVLPTLTPVTSTAAPVTPLISTSVAIILATIGATAIAVDASVSQADSFINVSPILSSASTFDVSVYVGALLSILASEALVINILDTQNGLYLPESGQLFQYEQISLNTTLDRVILVASDIINEIALLTPIEFILPETRVGESITLTDEEGNETDTSVLEKIWRPASIPEPATIIVLETSNVEEI